jgi:hypothetical protein
VEPDLITIQPQHLARCWLYQSHGNHQAPLKDKIQTS